MTEVFIVLVGEDHEGAEICAVFTNFNSAKKYLDEHYAEWEAILPDERRSSFFHNGQKHYGCLYACIERWDVK